MKTKIRKPKITDKAVHTKTLFVPLNEVLLHYDGLPESDRVAHILNKGYPKDLIRITLFRADGKPLVGGDDEVAKVFRFRVEGRGIDSDSVTRVRFPTLACGKNDDALVEIEMYVWEEEE